MTGMLASINSLEEALQIQPLAIDIIDLKNPAQGALGALPLNTVRQIVQHLGPEKALSATIGDLPMQAEAILNAVSNMAETGVDYIKIGFFPGTQNKAIIQMLGSIIQSSSLRLIAVLMADLKPDFSVLPWLAEAGFTGVMLDTAYKQTGSLLDVISPDKLQQFVKSARQYALLTGLAGSLRPHHIDDLLGLNPDYLGFRGALCRQHQRTAQLDPELIRHVLSHFSRHPPFTEHPKTTATL
jgi:dihydroneopterin aldolase